MTAVATSTAQAESHGSPWLFSKAMDVGVFGGSALLSLAFLGVGGATGALRGEAPDWAWVPAVLMVDVAHVWATGFRVYFDPDELRRRPALYTLAPALSYLGLVALYAQGAHLFWRVLAYVAIFHFVRQQAGWVALYRARAGERSGRCFDLLAVYAATVYPLLYWHTHARRFDWFVAGDLLRLPAWLERLAAPIYVLTLGSYAARAVYRGVVLGAWSPGKDLLVASTAVAWYVGIVALDSDYAFTVTNVFIHGVPYLALVYAYARAQKKPRVRPGLAGVVQLLATVWALAYLEELGWDRSLWGERAWLFGPGWELGGWGRFVVPLLAVPQVTHYVLDGFLWRRQDNPGLAALFPDRSR